MIEVADKNEYTLKVYTFLALSLMRENKFQNAYKIFNKAIEGLNLFEDHTQYEKYSKKGNTETASFWVNYLKWAKILYLPKDDTAEKVEKLLKIVSPKDEYFTEEQKANELFDQALG